MSVNLENHIFQNQQVPQSVQVLSKIVPDLPESVLDAVLKLVFDTVKKKPIPPKSLETLSKKAGITENADHLFSGLLMLVKAVLRLPQDTLKEGDLRLALAELKFSDEGSSKVVDAVSLHGKEYYQQRFCIKSDEYFLRLEKLNWRIDITISSNLLSKSLETVIIFQMLFTNGETKSFEVSIAKFHQLRFYVALMLKEMQFLEKKNVFKVKT